MIFGLFLAYHVSEVTDIDSPIDGSWYPKEFRKILTFRTPREQLDAFANIHCPASQMITAKTDTEFAKKVE